MMFSECGGERGHPRRLVLYMPHHSGDLRDDNSDVVPVS